MLVLIRATVECSGVVGLSAAAAVATAVAAIE